MTRPNNDDDSSVIGLIQRMHSLGFIAINFERISASLSGEHAIRLKSESGALIETLKILLDDSQVKFVGYSYFRGFPDPFPAGGMSRFCVGSEDAFSFDV